MLFLRRRQRPPTNADLIKTAVTMREWASAATFILAGFAEISDDYLRTVTPDPTLDADQLRERTIRLALARITASS